MNCAEVAERLDAFNDGELPATALLDVARHASGCTSCEEALRALAAMHQRIATAVEEEVDTLDLSGVWPAVAANVAREDARRAWRRRLRVAPALATSLALAAGAVVWLQTPAREPARVVATRNDPPRPNQAVIDRLDSQAARVELRRERKHGTTLIMVNADGGQAR
jgi:anti-sigma factor RsiW